MRIAKTLATVLVALTLAASLTGCQMATGVAGKVIEQARQLEVEQSHPQPSDTTEDSPLFGLNATLIRVVDGDTITVVPSEEFPATNAAGTEHAIRMLGIDTPELNKMSDKPAECGAQEATDHLADILSAGGSGGALTIVFDARSDQTDRFGRSLAYVQLLDGTDVALAMVTDGFAEAWFPYGEPEPARFPSYAEAQRLAVDTNVGQHAFCDSIGR